MPPNFVEKTFANSHKTTKFTKVFSLESFPLYSMKLKTWEQDQTQNIYLSTYSSTCSCLFTHLQSDDSALPALLRQQEAIARVDEAL